MGDALVNEGTTRPNHLWRNRADRAGEPYRNWKEITEEVAVRHGLTWAEILGGSSARRYAWARHEAWALIWAQGRLSLPEIGRRFERDHTTVLHGIRSHEKRQRA